MWKSAGAAACVAALTFAAPAGAAEALAIAKQGYFFVGGKYAPVGDKQVMTGQAYVEYQIPEKRTQPYPLVIVPGAAQTATNFNGTADGREGWTQYFLRRGYAVYMVEQPGRARSSYQPDTEGPQAYPQLLNVQQRFTAPEKYNLWPQAHLHTQWVGTGLAGDENFDQFFASQVPFVQKPEVTQALNRDAIAALIDKIGPVVLMTHSQQVDPNWRPYIQTPPFPSYTSGHSTISSAAAEVMTEYFGDKLSFTDTSLLEFGIRNRDARSFRDAAQEASISRLYGGIHYRFDLDAGNVAGRKVGELIVSRLRMRKN